MEGSERIDDRLLVEKIAADGKELYVVDFGVMKVKAGVIFPFADTGAIWRVTKKN